MQKTKKVYRLNIKKYLFFLNNQPIKQWENRNKFPVEQTILLCYNGYGNCKFKIWRVKKWLKTNVVAITKLTKKE